MLGKWQVLGNRYVPWLVNVGELYTVVFTTITRSFECGSKKNMYCVIWVLTVTGSHKTCWGALILVGMVSEFLTAGEKLLRQAHGIIPPGWETILQPCPKNRNRNRPRHWGFKRDLTHGLNMFKHGHYIPETKAPFLLRNRLRTVGASPPIRHASSRWWECRWFYRYICPFCSRRVLRSKSEAELWQGQGVVF